jgi:uncharacterized protein YkwD
MLQVLPPNRAATPARRLVVVLTVVLTVLAGWFVPVTSAEAKTPTATRLSTTSVHTAGGKRIAITGKNLSKVTAVYVGSTKVKKVTHVSSTRLKFTAPRHAVGTVKVRLVVGTKKYATSLRLTYTAYVRSPNSAEAEVLRLTNAARATARKCGDTAMPVVPALTWSGVLAGTAYAHGADMAARNYFAHTSKDGTSFDKRITQAGYRWNSVGENIAAGYPTAADVVKGWLKSPGHCRNIMSPNFTQLGVGLATGGKYGTYWTQDFGRPAA